jgi:hypothetical protein
MFCHLNQFTPISFFCSVISTFRKVVFQKFLPCFSSTSLTNAPSLPLVFCAVRHPAKVAHPLAPGVPGALPGRQQPRPRRHQALPRHEHVHPSWPAEFLVKFCFVSFPRSVPRLTLPHPIVFCLALH